MGKDMNFSLELEMGLKLGYWFLKLGGVFSLAGITKILWESNMPH